MDTGWQSKRTIDFFFYLFLLLVNSEDTSSRRWLKTFLQVCNGRFELGRFYQDKMPVWFDAKVLERPFGV
jgi:hypothetical protein